MFQIHIEDNGLTQRLEAIAQRAEHLPMQSIGELLLQSQLKNFAFGGRPSQWKPNLEGTQTLVKSGALRDSGEISSVGDTHVEITHGGKLPYRFIHQFGGVIRAKNVKYLKFRVNGQWVSKKEVVIPQRRYMRIQDEDVEAIHEILSGFIMEGRTQFAMETI